MGLQLVALNDDFSAFSYGRLGPTTTLLSGLEILAVQGSDEAATEINYAPGTPVAPTVVGTPTYSGATLVSNSTNYVNFGKIPTGSRTMIGVFFTPIATTAFQPFSAFEPAPTYGEYFEVTSTNTLFATITTGSANWPKISRAANRWDMYAVTVVNSGGLSIRRPRDAETASTSVVAGFDRTTPYRTGISGGGNVDTALFAYWSRALTNAEIDTFYNEMIDFLSGRGVDIT